MKAGEERRSEGGRKRRGGGLTAASHCGAIQMQPCKRGRQHAATGRLRVSFSFRSHFSPIPILLSPLPRAMGTQRMTPRDKGSQRRKPLQCGMA